MKKWWSILILTAMTLTFGGCVKRAHNFPPKDKTVKLDSTNLPIVWIEVGGDSIMLDKRINAHMKIIHNGEGRLNYADTLKHRGQHIDYEGFIAIRHRGNSTYNNSPKKAYSLRTLEGPLYKTTKKVKVSLLGMGKDNNWALLAPYSDKSMMRDLIAFEVSRPWMEYTPRGKYCELFLDGTYYGIHILTEVVSKGKHRLNLDKPKEAGDPLTGGYLMEVDNNDDVTYTSKFAPVTSSGEPIPDRHILFQYKSPDHEDLSRVQLEYIQRRIDQMEQALQTGNYRDYIDVMSFIDYQIAMELGHNVDAYRLSGKFFKRRDSEDPRFKMVLWDMNLAYGNSRRLEGWRTDTWVYQNNDLLYQSGETYLIPFWWQRLNADPDYRAQFKSRWSEYRRTNLSDGSINALIDSLATELTCQGAMQRNSQAWPRWGKRVWPNYYVATSFEDEIAFLKQWIADRIAWMDSQLQ